MNNQNISIKENGMENTITISKQEYIMLTCMAERIDTLERIYDRNGYMDETTIRAILGIPEKSEDEEHGEL